MARRQRSTGLIRKPAFDIPRGFIAYPEAAREQVLWSDAKVDPKGRIWAGTRDGNETDPRGSLWVA
jgi:sugar lactone lactonase YvrE